MASHKHTAAALVSLASVAALIVLAACGARLVANVAQAPATASPSSPRVAVGLDRCPRPTRCVR